MWWLWLRLRDFALCVRCRVWLNSAWFRCDDGLLWDLEKVEERESRRIEQGKSCIVWYEQALNRKLADDE